MTITVTSPLKPEQSNFSGVPAVRLDLPSGDELYLLPHVARDLEEKLRDVNTRMEVAKAKAGR